MSTLNEIQEVETKDDFRQSTFYKELVYRFAISTVKLPDDKERLHEIRREAREVIESLGPKDPIETMLLIQLSSTHILQQDMVLYAKNADMRIADIQTSYVNAATKLSNLFVAQVNLLQKLRAQDPKAAVGAVHVHEGAQAVVGTVNINQASEDKK